MTDNELFERLKKAMMDRGIEVYSGIETLGQLLYDTYCLGGFTSAFGAIELYFEDDLEAQITCLQSFIECYAVNAGERLEYAKQYQEILKRKWWQR